MTDVPNLPSRVQDQRPWPVLPQAVRPSAVGTVGVRRGGRRAKVQSDNGPYSAFNQCRVKESRVDGQGHGVGSTVGRSMRWERASWWGHPFLQTQVDATSQGRSACPPGTNPCSQPAGVIPISTTLHKIGRLHQATNTMAVVLISVAHLTMLNSGDRCMVLFRSDSEPSSRRRPRTAAKFFHLWHCCPACPGAQFTICEYCLCDLLAQRVTDSKY